jgi:hypothetical protein
MSQSITIVTDNRVSGGNPLNPLSRFPAFSIVSRPNAAHSPLQMLGQSYPVRSFAQVWGMGIFHTVPAQLSLPYNTIQPDPQYGLRKVPRSVQPIVEHLGVDLAETGQVRWSQRSRGMNGSPVATVSGLSRSVGPLVEAMCPHGIGHSQFSQNLSL